MSLYQIYESNIESLYKSTVEAFPLTTRRQYSTDTIKLTNFKWTPYLGMRTLFVSALAQNEGREYNPIILFKNVTYNEDGLPLVASDGTHYHMQELSLANNDVVLRCQCKDFLYRWHYFDHVDRSLYGTNRKKYEGRGLWEANPKKLPGMCKHLIKMVKVLNNSGVLVDN